MRLYIKRIYRASILLFTRGNDEDFARVEAIEAHNSSIAERVYTGIMNGSIEHAHIRDGKRLIIYHRSTRGEFVQASYFVDLNGSMEASMHVDVTAPAKLAETLIHGKYINCAAA